MCCDDRVDIVVTILTDIRGVDSLNLCTTYSPHLTSHLTPHTHTVTLSLSLSLSLSVIDADSFTGDELIRTSGIWRDGGLGCFFAVVESSQAIKVMEDVCRLDKHQTHGQCVVTQSSHCSPLIFMSRVKYTGLGLKQAQHRFNSTNKKT